MTILSQIELLYLAALDAYPVQWLKAMLVLLLALVVAISMKIVGVLLISALLTISAAEFVCNKSGL